MASTQRNTPQLLLTPEQELLHIFLTLFLDQVEDEGVCVTCSSGAVLAGVPCSMSWNHDVCDVFLLFLGSARMEMAWSALHVASLQLIGLGHKWIVIPVCAPVRVVELIAGPFGPHGVKRLYLISLG